MTIQDFFPFLLCLLLAFFFSSCVSSEEAGSGKSVGGPQTTQASYDSARLAAQADSLARLDSLRSKRGGFTSRQDTLVAAVTRKSKATARLIKPIERPANPAYTVQVGAFARTKNALQSQKLAKERFADLPIFNHFEPYDKLYRVRVGKFDTRAQADSLRKEMVKQFSQEYSEAWINYISK